MANPFAADPLDVILYAGPDMIRGVEYMYKDDDTFHKDVASVAAQIEAYLYQPGSSASKEASMRRMIAALLESGYISGRKLSAAGSYRKYVVAVAVHAVLVKTGLPNFRHLFTGGRKRQRSGSRRRRRSKTPTRKKTR
jgi:hypothetical protein